MDRSIEIENLDTLELAPESRSFRLREMCWRGTHEAAQHTRRIVGCGEDTLVGHARDFAAVLEASEPFIQDDELIVGGCLVTPGEGSDLALGHYDPHFPPNYEKLLRLGLPGIRDEAQARGVNGTQGSRSGTDSDRRAFLEAVAISYEAACRYVERYAHLADEMSMSEAVWRRREELGRLILPESWSRPVSAYTGACRPRALPCNRLQSTAIDRDRLRPLAITSRPFRAPGPPPR